MQAPNQTPPVAHIEDVPLEVFRAETEGYRYYYPFNLNNERENKIYTDSI
jgi:hypothetical protein